MNEWTIFLQIYFHDYDAFDLSEHGDRKEPVDIQALMQKIKAAGGKSEVGRKKSTISISDLKVVPERMLVYQLL